MWSVTVGVVCNFVGVACSFIDGKPREMSVSSWESWRQEESAVKDGEESILSLVLFFKVWKWLSK